MPLINDIEMLKIAAQNHEWENCKTLLGNILRKTNKERVAFLAIEYAELYLPRFKSQYPDDDWVEKRLMEARQVIQSDSNRDSLPIFPDRQRQYDNPVTRTYRGAIGSIWAMTKSKSIDGIANHASDSIATIIVVLRTEWDKWLPHQYENLPTEELSYVRYGTFLWLDLAETLSHLHS